MGLEFMLESIGPVFGLLLSSCNLLRVCHLTTIRSKVQVEPRIWSTLSAALRVWYSKIGASSTSLKTLIGNHCQDSSFGPE